MKKRLKQNMRAGFCITVCTALVTFIFFKTTVTVAAYDTEFDLSSNNVKITEADKSYRIYQSSPQATTNTVEISNNSDVTLDGVNICVPAPTTGTIDADNYKTKNPIDITGDYTVTIRLADGTTNTLKSGYSDSYGGSGKAAIHLPSNANLTICGDTGVLNAYGADGQIEATSGPSGSLQHGGGGAGIGGNGGLETISNRTGPDIKLKAPENGGNVTISGGVLNIYGGNAASWGGGGAGIGGGGAAYLDTDKSHGSGKGAAGGNVTVAGGTVTVRSGHGNFNVPGYDPTSSGNAIGGGGNSYANPGCGGSGTITVTGGSLTAVSNGDGGGSAQPALGAAPDVSTLTSEYRVTGSTDTSGSDAVTYVSADNSSYKWFRAGIPVPDLPAAETPVNDSPAAEAAVTSPEVSEGNKPEPIVCVYTADRLGASVVVDRQGASCSAAFSAAVPDSFEEAYSVNLLIGGKKDQGKKDSGLSFNILKSYQRPGRVFMLIGIDGNGQTHIFPDTDTDDSLITVRLDGFSGYAFDLIFTDAAAVSKNMKHPGNTVSGDGYYTVISGDTLSRIAAALSQTVDYLAEKNSIADPNLIFPGQKILY